MAFEGRLVLDHFRPMMRERLIDKNKGERNREDKRNDGSVCNGEPIEPGSG